MNSDAIEEAYKSTGARARAKDVVLFFFYLVVRDNVISFVNSVLDAGEIDETENESEGLTEIIYAQNKSKSKGKAEQEEEAGSQRLLRGLAGLEDSAGKGINPVRSAAYANEKDALAMLHMTRAKAERLL